MKTWSFFNLSTGMFGGATFTGTAETLKLNTPSGCGAMEGQIDHLSRRVDLVTGEVIDWQPPQPSPDYEWDADSRRWRLLAEVAEREANRAAALTAIQSLEAKQPRAMRELALGYDGAKQRLQTIDDAILAHRATLSEQTGAT